MPKLAQSAVFRGGVTSNYIYIEPTVISASSTSGSRPRVTFDFKMKSKGGGTTQIQLRLSSEDFSTVLKMMSEADRMTALKAMSAEVSKQISSLK